MDLLNPLVASRGREVQWGRRDLATLGRVAFNCNLKHTAPLERGTAQRRRCLYPRVPCGEWNFLAGGRHAPNHPAARPRGTSRDHYLVGGLDEQPTLKLIP